MFKREFFRLFQIPAASCIGLDLLLSFQSSMILILVAMCGSIFFASPAMTQAVKCYDTRNTRAVQKLGGGYSLEIRGEETPPGSFERIYWRSFLIRDGECLGAYYEPALGFQSRYKLQLQSETGYLLIKDLVENKLVVLEASFIGVPSDAEWDEKNSVVEVRFHDNFPKKKFFLGHIFPSLLSKKLSQGDR